MPGFAALVGIPQEILAGSNSSHFQRGKSGSKKKWGDDLTKIPTFGISTGFSDGKNFNWCFAAACPRWGPEEKTGDKAQGGAFRRHKDLTEPGTAESWNPAGLREGSAGQALTSPQWSQLHLPGILSSHSSTTSVPSHGCAPASAQDAQQTIYSHTQGKGRFELRKSCFT